MGIILNVSGFISQCLYTLLPLSQKTKHNTINAHKHTIDSVLFYLPQFSDCNCNIKKWRSLTTAQYSLNLKPKIKIKIIFIVTSQVRSPKTFDRFL